MEWTIMKHEVRTSEKRNSYEREERNERAIEEADICRYA